MRFRKDFMPHRRTIVEGIRVGSHPASRLIHNGIASAKGLMTFRGIVNCHNLSVEHRRCGVAIHVLE
jgi:hypothetical protein